jgi:hypothetical protein
MYTHTDTYIYGMHVFLRGYAEQVSRCTTISKEVPV